MADLRDEIQADLVDAWINDIRDIARPCTYISFSGRNPDFNPSDSYSPYDPPVPEPPSQEFTFNAVFDIPVNRYIPNEVIQDRDKILIFLSSFMIVKPRINDFAIDEFNVKYRVVVDLGDPAGAHYELLIRPIDE